MYTILEHRQISKLLKKAPLEIKKSYLVWKRIVELQGPDGLKMIKGFHDEALKGEWKGFRSSRLSRKWRVIYKINEDQFIVYVVELGPHNY